VGLLQMGNLQFKQEQAKYPESWIITREIWIDGELFFRLKN